MRLSHSVGNASARSSLVAGRSPAVPRLRTTAAAASSVLERPHVDVVVPPGYADLLPSLGQDSKGFQDYESATQRMQELERLSAELLENLSELNMASEALDATPVPDFFQLEHQEARRAKRAAAREARKSSASAKATAAHRSDKAVVTSPPTTSSLQQTATTSASDRRSSSVSAAVAATAQPQSVAAYERQGQTQALVAGPSLRAGPSIAGPSIRAAGPSLASVSRKATTSAAAAGSVQAEPSAWAREANAKRAGARGTRRSVAAAAGQDGTTRTRASASGGSTDGTTQFMKKSGGYDLLNGVSEKELANIVKDLLFVERVKDELKGILKREPSMAEWATALGMDSSAFTMRLNAGQHAKSIMLQANYRLVIAICKKYQHRGMALQDLITEGVRGLLTGVEKFDADKGFRFSTYAHWWIRQAVTRAVTNQTREVRLPSHMMELVTRVKAAQAALVEQLNRDPTVQEVAGAVQMTPKRIKEILAMQYQSASLDSAIGSPDDSNTWKDLLEDERGTPDDNLEETMFGKEMDTMLADLTEREAGVIKMRFGLGGEPLVTLEEIGIRFQLTRERIRQIEAKAIRKLKAKHTYFAGILEEYTAAQASVELTGRSSHGTNKSG